MSFVHLHVHSHYSFLSGLWKPGVYAKRAKELGMPAVALTDAGNLYGVFEFYKACKAEGVKAIVGVEFQISKKGRANRDKDNETYQIVLIARDFEGYQNLIQLVTKSYLEGYYYGKPRIDFELLELHKAGLLALSGDHTGEIAQHVITGKDENFIRERLDFYEALYGKGNFYLEIQEHADRGTESKINQAFVDLSKKYAYPAVATNHVYYSKQDDAEAQDFLACIGSGRPLEDPDRSTLIEGDYSMRSSEEMAELFAYFPKALENTLEVMEKTNLVIPYGETLIPKFELDETDLVEYRKYADSIPKGTKRIDEEEWKLRRLCYTGLNRRFDFGIPEETINEFIHKKDLPKPEKKLSDMSLDELIDLSKAYQTDAKKSIIAAMDEKKREIVDRIEYELTVVDLMGFNGYFNIVSDFINWAKDREIPVGPWRGSAAGALLAYLSGITDIDPLRYGLLFERFLNPSRISMPDIDVDFSDEGRDRVLEYVRNKYGSDHVAQICTFGTMAARAAVKDVGKVLGVPFSEMNAFAALIPAKPGTKLKDALEESVEFKSAYENDPKYRKIIENALKLEGTVRQLGVHACAVIIAPKPMTNYCALQHPPKDVETVVTQLSQYPLEDLGLLKMDFLGLRNLTIIKRCLEIVKNQHQRDIDLLKIDYEDKKVFKIFSDGDTTGIFQFESAGMRKYLRELKPNCFEDIIVMVSLYRPGPIAYIPTYIARKHGKEQVEYPHPSLETILKPTQGIAVYQEQIMQLVQAFAGFSLGEADILRRAIGKKKIDLLMEQKEKFIDAAKSQWHAEALAKYIFEDIIEPFAGYGFNKSHAACYSMISYQTAFLKAYYPTEFMTALMVSDEEDTERITMEIEECKAKDITVLPPDVNESMKHFTYIDPKHVRFGLKAVKGLGDAPIDAIREGRKEKPYSDALEFLTSAGPDVVNRKTLEALVLSGAMDRFGERAVLLASISKMTAYAKEHEHKNQTSQTGLFDFGHVEMEHLRFDFEKATPMSYEEKIRGEKASIGYSVSGHPLDGLKTYVEKRTIGKEHVTAFKRRMSEREEVLVHEEGEDFHPAGAENPKAAVSKAESGSATQDSGPQDSMPPPPPPENEGAAKKKDRDPRVRFMGVVTAVRKVQTKTGKMMAIGSCDSFDFRFTVVVFPKDYDTLWKLLEEDRILLVEGNLKCSEENGEISVIANQIRTNTITSIREQAMDMKLFEPKAKVSFYDFTATSEGNGSSSEIFVLSIPRIATKADLLDFKAFLLNEPTGTIRVELDLNGQKIDTKMSVASIDGVQKWVANRWSVEK